MSNDYCSFNYTQLFSQIKNINHTNVAQTIIIGEIEANISQSGNLTSENISIGIINPYPGQSNVAITGNLNLDSNKIIMNPVSIGLNTTQIGQGTNCISIGTLAGERFQGNDTSFSVIAIGTNSGSILQRNRSIAIGNQSGLSNQNQQSIAIGDESGEISQGTSSIAIGRLAGFGNLTNSSITIGTESMRNGASIGNTNSISIGTSSGRNLQRSRSIAIGNQAGQNFQSFDSVAIGNQAAESNAVASSISIGIQSGQLNTQSGCISIGAQSGLNKTSGGTNTVAVGSNAGRLNQGGGSVAIGSSSGRDNQSSSALAIGLNSGFTSQSTYCIAIGTNAQTGGATTGPASHAIGIGWQSGDKSQRTRALAIGRQSGQNTQGQEAIAIGYFAGQTSQGTSAVAIGYNSGVTSQGTNSIAIGTNSGLTSQSPNSIVMNASGSVLNGNLGTSRLYIRPIRSASGEPNLRYNSTTYEITYDSSLSDQRIKKNITPINDDESLNILSNIEVYKYQYIDGEKTSDYVYGFMAQQVETQVPYAVTHQNGYLPDVYKDVIATVMEDKILKIELTNHNLNIGDKIKIIDKIRSDIYETIVSMIIDVNTFYTQPIESFVYNIGTTCPLFIYGKYTENLLGLDKNYLFCINFSATQKLLKRVEQLEIAINNLKSNI